jgi:hypothetical protein
MLLSFSHFPLTAVSCIAVIKLSNELVQPLLMQCEHDSVHSANRATVISAGALITDILVIIIDLIMGKIADININYSIIAGASFMIIGLFMFLNSFKNSTH